MTKEYAVFNQDGLQMGTPVKAFPTQQEAEQFMGWLTAATQRMVEEAEHASEMGSGVLPLSGAQREELQDLIIRGERARATTYAVKVREVGPWQTT